MNDAQPSTTATPDVPAGSDAVDPRILIVTPCKDEAEYLQRTVDSLAQQEVRPALWIIVDDGSTDATPEISDRAAEEHDWIQVIHRPAGRERRVGPGVIDAFYHGLESVDWRSFDFVCKLDGDLEFGPRYFANLMERFDADPRLGTASGKAHIPVDDRFVLERTSDEFSHGVAKLYRRTCFEEIGGFVREVMWDGIDCHRCRMLQWRAASYDDPELKILHLRQMGSSHKSVFHGRRRWGFGQYFMGTHPLYMLGISTYRMAERPWILGGVNLMIGYLDSWIRRRPQYDDPEFRKFLHRWQFHELKRRFFGGPSGNDLIEAPTADH